MKTATALVVKREPADLVASRTTLRPVAVRDRDDGLAEILQALPLQSAKRAEVVAEEMIQCRFGRLYTEAEMLDAMKEAIPARSGHNRIAHFDRIMEYRQVIPDDVLLKYGEAKQAGAFADFYVAHFSYAQRPITDPWLIGEIKIGSAHKYAVLAKW